MLGPTVDTIGTKLSQGLIELLLDLLAGVSLGVDGVPFGGDGKATVFPTCVFRPCFAFAADVHPGRVDLVVTFGLKVVQALFVIV